MNGFKIRFADILRYFFLGGVEFLMFYWLVPNSNSVTRTIINLLPFYTEQTAPNTLLTTLAIAAICIFLYLLGFVTQLIMQLLLGGDLFCSGVGEVAECIRFMPRMPFNKRNNPDWLYWSDNPRRVVDIYKNVLETEDENETKTEFLYSNQLFQGIAFSAFLISMSVFISNIILCKFSECSIPFSILFVGSVVVLILVLCILHWFFGKGKYIVIPVVLGYSVGIILPFLGKDSDDKIVSLCICVAYMTSLLLAKALARSQIRRIDILANFNEDSSSKFNKILARVGAPKAYVLMRAHRSDYIGEALESIAMQDYPNIKVIVLLDGTLDEESETKNKIKELVNQYQQCKEKPGHLNIQLYESSQKGPAALSYEIRKIFIQQSNYDDIAITLDSDDRFYSQKVVSNIVTKLYKTQSNICLIRFEIFGIQKLNYGRNFHNGLVKDLCYRGPISKAGNSMLSGKSVCSTTEKCSPITPDKLLKNEKLYKISTIGWTKAYKKEMLYKYVELLKGANKDFDKNTVYEDFPDIRVLLSKDSKICTVAKNSIMFRKSAGSATTSVTKDNYDKYIPYFLKLAKELTEVGTDTMIKGGKEVVAEKLIPYKFVQYLNIVYHMAIIEPEKLDGYSCKDFYDSILDYVLVGKDAAERDSKEKKFQENILAIINDDDCYNILGPENFPMKLQLAKNEGAGSSKHQKSSQDEKFKASTFTQRCLLNRSKNDEKENQWAEIKEAYYLDYKKYTPYFLHLNNQLENEYEDEPIIIKNDKKVAYNKRIPFRFIQYLNIVYHKSMTNPKEIYGYSCKDFYDSILDYVLVGKDAAERDSKEGQFQDDILAFITDEDYCNILGAENFPKELLKNLQDKKTKKEKWELVANSYKIKNNSTNEQRV